MSSLRDLAGGRPNSVLHSFARAILCTALLLPLATAGCGGDGGTTGGVGGRCVVGTNASIPLQWQGTVADGGMNAAWQMSLKGGTANVVDMFISGQGPGGGTIVADLTGGRNGCICDLRGSASESVPNMPAGRRYSMTLSGKFEDQGGAMIFKGAWRLMTVGTNLEGNAQGSSVSGSAHIDTSSLPIPGATFPPPGTGIDTGSSNIPGTDTGGVQPGIDVAGGATDIKLPFDMGAGTIDPGMEGFDPGVYFDYGSGTPDQGGFDPGFPVDVNPFDDPGIPDEGGPSARDRAAGGSSAGRAVPRSDAAAARTRASPAGRWTPGRVARPAPCCVDSGRAIASDTGPTRPRPAGRRRRR